MAYVVTGGSGFVGAALVPRLAARGHRVLVLDNFVRGRREFLAHLEGANGPVHVLDVDCSNADALRAAFRVAAEWEPIEAVWHLAANSDIPAGVADPHVDFKDTFLTTFATLLVMREFDVRTIHFASSSAIYGDFKDTRIAEGTAPYRPISNYGAMKLASEAQISAASASFLERADVFRFPNVVGRPATHGVILDFIEKLKRTPDRLDVLGNGTQRKAYLHIEDLIDAMLFIAERGPDPVNIYNIGPPDDGVTVSFIAETVVAAVSPGARIVYGDGDRGWVGDVPRFSYNVDKLARLGWKPSMGSVAAVRRAVGEIASTLEMA